MYKFEHMNFDKRKIITNELSVRGSSAKVIAELIYCDPTAVSKEVRRNRFISKEAIDKRDPICKKTLRFPYVCNNCGLKDRCLKRQYRYEAHRAQKSADYRLVVPRKGINLNEEEFEILDKKIKDGMANNKSIYTIVTSDPDITVSVPTVYKYINDRILTTKRTDLPYATKYKKRKRQIKEYDYPNNSKIDRSNRTFLDYLVFKRDNPSVFTTQMDFLGSIKTDSKSILTLTLVDLHFSLIFNIKKKNSHKIVGLFNQLEDHLGMENFQKIFNVILTDRDPSFSDYLGIELSAITGEERTKVFYCDSFKSNQKGSVENTNKQLRRFFPKKTSVDNIDDSQIKAVMRILNENNKPLLSGYSANEAFIALYGQELLNKLYSFVFIDEEYNK